MKKVGDHNSFSRILFFCLALMLSFTTISFAQDVAKGKELFNSNCAACHKLDGNSTGPSLRGVVERHDGDVEWLHKWIKSSSSLIKSGDARAVKLFEEWNKVVMNDFPGLSDEDIDNILAYTSEPKAEVQAPTQSAGTAQGGGDGVSDIIVLGALTVVLLLLVTMLFFVRKVLNKVIESNGLAKEIHTTIPIWKAFVKNQFLVIVSVLVWVLVGSFCVWIYDADWC
jgi:cytochrome c2